MKVLIADSLAPQAAQRLHAAGVQADDRAGIELSELLSVLPEYQGLIVRSRTKVTAEVLAAGSNLKVVGRAGVGVDNIDLAAAAAHNVAVVNTPVSTSVAVAELTLALMLAIVRSVPRADASMKAGGWDKKSFEGAELAGKTLGILGMGNIGAKVARRAAAFDMDVRGFDPFLDDATIQTRGALAARLDEIYSESDVITLHLPLLSDTRGLLNETAFEKMKRGVYIVCAARGGVIDEDALLTALNRGQVAGAALDVFATEPPGTSPLVTHPNVIATPHMGAQTAEAQTRAAMDVADEVANVLLGKPMRWEVK
ncbi:MAG TPA: hydroxyacid dehydrogenase [Anaerolineales bacterium]|nr:hydroxyacid dehydrogenase [Anaerolineales bacterium]HRQ91577.1 hydroxyacid dehydrogenase [Anaerolineales bacterium]